MTNTTHSTAAVEIPAAIKKATGDKWLRLHAADVVHFSKCDLSGLEQVYDALRFSADALNGVYNRPAVDVEGPDGDYIEHLCGQMDERVSALIEHVRRRVLTTVDEYDAYCRILIKYQSDCEPDLGVTALLIEQLKGKNPELVGRA